MSNAVQKYTWRLLHFADSTLVFLSTTLVSGSLICEDIAQRSWSAGYRLYRLQPTEANYQPGQLRFKERTFTTSKGPVANGPRQAALKPEPMDWSMLSCLPSPSCLPQSSRSKLFFAQNRHIWLVPFRMIVGVAPDHKPRNPSSFAMMPTAWMGPCT